MVADELNQWTSRPPVRPVLLEGAYARLEPLAPHHAPDLLAATLGRPELFAYLPDEPPETLRDVAVGIDARLSDPSLVMSAVIDRATGRAEGRHALMRIEPAHGVAELGHVLWGPRIARSRVTTEAFLLHASHVFDTLGYRRLEWKCNDQNEPSKRAALRLGFTYEGLFRQHMVVKGRNRDTAWFAILDREWPAIRARISAWLDPANFDADGLQRSPLARG